MTDDIDVCPKCSGTIGWKDVIVIYETGDSNSSKSSNNSHNNNYVECLGCGDMYPSKDVLRLCFE